MTSPAIIDESPKKRICPSDSSIALRNAYRHTRGAVNGRMPSITSMSANAPASSSII